MKTVAMSAIALHAGARLFVFSAYGWTTQAQPTQTVAQHVLRKLS
jgi:hypothetical protein